MGIILLVCLILNYLFAYVVDTRSISIGGLSHKLVA